MSDFISKEKVLLVGNLLEGIVCGLLGCVGNRCLVGAFGRRSGGFGLGGERFFVNERVLSFGSLFFVIF